MSVWEPSVDEGSTLDLKRSVEARNRRNYRRESKLWHTPSNDPIPLGCSVCRDREICGGLKIPQGMFDCLEFCCNNPATCDRVCRANPSFFAKRWREVGGFNIFDTDRAPSIEHPNLPNFIPIIYHNSRLVKQVDHSAVCLPLYRMFNKRTGYPRYATREELCKNFSIGDSSGIVLTGTEEDNRLESWWALGTEGRREVIRALRDVGVELVTVPNYSLFTDRPRWDDLHAMKRIAITHSEFQQEGVPAALHVNGRTEKDFERWAEFVNSRPEVKAVSYEFGTGAGWQRRRNQHIEWLRNFAEIVQRPLTLYIRGSISSASELARTFECVRLLDTNVFLKATYRKKAQRGLNGKVEWEGHSTKFEEPIDDIFHHNIRVVEAALKENMREVLATD